MMIKIKENINNYFIINNLNKYNNNINIYNKKNQINKLIFLLTLIK